MASAPLVEPAYPATSDRSDALSASSTMIVERLRNLAAEQVTLRASIETRWLEDLRAYHARYDEVTEKELSGSKRSRAFIGLARSKSNAWIARIGDLLFPADDKNWGVGPTPVPELTDQAKGAAAEAERHHAAAAAKVDQANQAGNMGDTGQQGALLAQAAEHGEMAVTAETAEQEAQAAMDEARKRAAAMQLEIDDQLTECHFSKRARDVVEDGVKIGVGVMKGPIVANRARRQWVADPEQPNDYQLNSQPDARPEARRVDPWAFFPQMNATSMDDCEFTFERHLPTRTELRRMQRTLGFDADAVRRLLTDGPDTYSTTSLNHLTQLRAITNEGQAVKDRYVLWEYHGPLESEEICTLLRAAGDVTTADEIAQAHDPLDEHMVVCWFCGTELLLLHPEYMLDSNESLYSVFSFEKGEASILGAIGIPRIIMDAQRAANGAWRMMLDNGALSVGPQIVVDKTLIEPENGDWTLSALKVWLKTGQEIAQGVPPFQVFNIPNNQAQLAGIIELALKFIDEESALPMLAQGEQGPASPTMGGMTMLFNSANVVFRRVVRNWDDDLTTPIIRRFYDWNMQFSKKDAIKGDMQVEARGTSVLLVREMMAQQLAAIVTQWTTHPILSLMLKTKGFDAAEQLLQSLSMSPDTILDTKDAFEKALQQMAENSGAAPPPEQIRADAQVKVATITADSRQKEADLQYQIALVHRDTELTKLASAHELTLEDLKTRLGIEHMKTQSKERIFAGEIGAETQMAADARAHGERPAPSGGYVSAPEPAQ